MFGKKEVQAPSTGEAIQKLRETENMLIKKQEFLEKKIEQELDVAKKNASKNKRGTLISLVTRLSSPFISSLLNVHNDLLSLHLLDS